MYPGARDGALPGITSGYIPRWRTRSPYSETAMQLQTVRDAVELGEAYFWYTLHCSPFALFFSSFRSKRGFTAGDFTVRFYRAGMATYGRYSSAFYP